MSSELSINEVRAELARVLSSELFLKSPQLSRFLRFCVDETLAGQQDCLKEQVLGTDVFRRSAPFDPRLDPIVRVEARRLRSKLEQYYTGEGAMNPVILSFLRGDYVPRFIRANHSVRPAPSASPARILVVQNARLASRDLETRLKNLGYDVVGSVDSGEAVLEAVQELKPDIVLMDIVLSGQMRGADVARRIWSGWRIPVVYLTAFSDALVLEDVKGSDPYGYILKPFDSKQLHVVLQLALSRRNREAAEDSISGDRQRQYERLLTALANARIQPIDWIVRDTSLPWPDSVETPPPDVLTGVDLDPEKYLERIVPSDRERVQECLTQAIRSASNFECSYRRQSSEAGEEWVFATGAVARDASGRLRLTGVEIRNTSSPAPG